MNKTKPQAYLKLMMSTKGSSTNKCSSSLTVSEGNIPLEDVDKILQQLKTKLIEVELFETLENNFIQG